MKITLLSQCYYTTLRGAQSASCQLFASHLLPASLCTKVLNSNARLSVAVVCRPAEPRFALAELCLQDTSTARCLGTVCQRQFVKIMAVQNAQHACFEILVKLRSDAHPAKRARAGELLVEGGAASV